MATDGLQISILLNIYAMNEENKNIEWIKDILLGGQKLISHVISHGD